MADILKKTMGADTTAGPPAGKIPPPAAEPRVSVQEGPRTSEGLDLVAAAASGYGPAFKAEGLRAAPGPDGVLEIVDKSGRPADARALESLRRRIEAQPRLLVRRPDLYQVIDPGTYGRLQAKLTTPGASSTPEFRHMGRPARDYIWTKTCDKVSGDCNQNAVESSYKQNEEVSPETLANIAKRLKEIGDGGDKDWAAYVEAQNADYERATKAKARGGFMRLPSFERLLAGLSSAMGRGASVSATGEALAGGPGVNVPVGAGRAGASASSAGARARGETTRSQGEPYHGEEKAASWLWLKLLLAALGTGIYFYARRLKRQDEPKARRIQLN